VGVESLRNEYVKAIPGEIAALEEIVSANRFGHVSAGDIQRMLERAGCLLTLSGTFGCTRLDTVVKRFCDLGIGMMEKRITSVAPIEVHLRTMWLVAPSSPALTDDEAESLLNELAKIHVYYGFKCAQPDADASNEEIDGR
jgi:hypothetical protein